MKYSTLLKTLVACALFHTVICVPRGLVTNITKLCSNSNPCSWNDVNIWEDGVVPLEEDTVDMRVAGTYTIQVSGNVRISDFRIGIDEIKDNGDQTLHVLSGASFYSDQSLHAYIHTTVQVDANASFVVKNAGFTQGYFVLGGFASFGGSNPSLEVDTKNLQVSTDIKYGRLSMSEGSVLVVSQGLSISDTSRIEGSGDINGTIFLDGNMHPGTKGKIGRFNVVGDIRMGSSTRIYLDIESRTVFDQVVLTGTMAQDGDLYIETIKDYTPLAHSQFVVFNHSGQSNGFDKTTEDCTITCLNNKWEVRVDQDYTFLVYDSATTAVLSFILITSCLFFTLF
jgi:hypothetical protein